jgi:hypothetical protein
LGSYTAADQQANKRALLGMGQANKRRPATAAALLLANKEEPKRALLLLVIHSRLD